MNPAVTLNILLIDDEAIIHQTLGDYLRDCGHQVRHADHGQAGLELLDHEEFDLVILDIRMPGAGGLELLQKLQQEHPELAVIMISGHGTVETVIEALRRGAVDYLTKPVKLGELDVALERVIQSQQLRRDLLRLHGAVEGIQSPGFGEQAESPFVGVSDYAGQVREQINLAVTAGCDTILLSGETGTGKEVVAREIHRQSCSNARPFIAVACPALPESLAESELFGHVRGAFTGASQARPGYFEMADQGTLFLDEIADLAPGMQAKLLRVLETRLVRRVGGTREIPINTRIIAASNVPFEELVATGKFRQDLYYRLNVFAIRLQPLRAHREDVLPLAKHFLTSLHSRRPLTTTTLSASAEQMLQQYSFPGNARELRNIIERAVIICREPQLEPQHLLLNLGTLETAAPLVSTVPLPSAGEHAAVDEKSKIMQALIEAKWNRRKAAELLRMPYSTLRFKINKLGIK